jgi:hypothetical protein
MEPSARNNPASFPNPLPAVFSLLETCGANNLRRRTAGSGFFFNGLPVPVAQSVCVWTDYRSVLVACLAAQDGRLRRRSFQQTFTRISKRLQDFRLPI